MRRMVGAERDGTAGGAPLDVGRPADGAAREALWDSIPLRGPRGREGDAVAVHGEPDEPGDRSLLVGVLDEPGLAAVEPRQREHDADARRPATPHPESRGLRADDDRLVPRLPPAFDDETGPGAPGDGAPVVPQRLDRRKIQRPPLRRVLLQNVQQDQHRLRRRQPRQHEPALDPVHLLLHAARLRPSSDSACRMPKSITGRVT
mmetsp:Transcript_6132/g.18509  ORF Transcript_6132/g.18509 Transcript_6132/m.18509 type:complete len:204 (-) Transcript_6132:27-638(-)